MVDVRLPFGVPTKSAFGDASPTRRELSDVGFSLMEAAENLLNKALGALQDGDADRARRLVNRTLALDFDEHNGSLPAAWGVYMLLHNTVSDELEESDPGTHVWLDAAEGALAHADGTAGSAMRASRSALLMDAELTSGEQQRCAAAGRGETSEFWSDARPGEVSAETVLDVLRLVAEYLDTVDRMRPLD